ncbi:hypothetical protein [Cohnella fermenti]|uniref:Uncharacterized protein n=1 Tax=Cohnella fermenti TaxID=2565925 RepID=A0A4S4BJV2_9BACL|nr:hypothetical protein [Cohnella fermenti]THF74395.1 hypothetical protein E6C55_25470 [Cohnella fermenti]
MEALSEWLLAVFRKRMDALDANIARNSRETVKYRQTAEFRERLCQMLSKEQFELLAEWEAGMNERFSTERETWYLSGLSDGIALTMEMDELSRGLPKRKKE